MRRCKRPIVSFLLFLLVVPKASGQILYSFTDAASRAKHDKHLVDVIHGSLQQPVSPGTEKNWKSAFWAMELMLYKTPATEEKLLQAWKNANALSESFQKDLLEVSYTLYPGAFDKEVETLLKTTSSPAVFIRCAEYLLRTKKYAKRKEAIQQLICQKFSNEECLGLTLLNERLAKKSIEKTPLIKDLFSRNFLSGQTIIYSLQRSNRDYPGLVLIRKPDGNFVRNSDGTIFHSSQLARAITGYPYYLTNGNTPQGLFRWTGFDTSSVTYIGPTPNLQLVMPYEATPVQFFGDSSLAAVSWSKEMYAALLPSSLKEYNNLYESFYAGAMGRSEIIMHGTTINPAYYRGQPYFPQTPSLGCLCSYEEWDNTGKRVMSNQQAVVDALTTIGANRGYVVVIDLDNLQRPVRLNEIASLIK